MSTADQIGAALEEAAKNPTPPWATALNAVRRAVADIVEATDGDAGVKTVPMYEGDPWAKREPLPEPGLRAALIVAGQAQRTVDDYALAMRGAGASWLDVAAALGITDGQPYQNKEAAFEQIAGPESAGFMSTSVVRWTCGSCGQVISDSGPYEAAPYNNETGHGAGCERHTAEVLAYEKSNR